MFYFILSDYGSLTSAPNVDTQVFTHKNTIFPLELHMKWNFGQLFSFHFFKFDDRKFCINFLHTYQPSSSHLPYKTGEGPIILYYGSQKALNTAVAVVSSRTGGRQPRLPTYGYWAALLAIVSSIESLAIWWKI